MNEYLPIIGADPEAFIWDPKKEEIISAKGIVPGTKKRPKKVSGGAVQVDGIMAEYNINPAQTSEEFVHNNETVKKELTKIIKNKASHLELMFFHTVRFSPKHFKTFSKEELEVGCVPDFEVNHHNLAKPIQKAITYPENYRFAGGHIHIGNLFNKWDTTEDRLTKCSFYSMANNRHGRITYNKMSNETKKRIRHLCFIKGDSGIRSDNRHNYNFNMTKRAYIFSATRFRMKDYGVELRGPDNAWAETPATAKALFHYIFLNTLHKMQNSWAYTDTTPEMIQKASYQTPARFLSQKV